MTFEMYIISSVVFGVACALIGYEKGRSQLYFALYGVLFGPLGFVMAAISRPNRHKLDDLDVSLGLVKRCPACAETIRPEAKACKHCGADLGKPKVATIIKTRPSVSSPGKIDALCSCGKTIIYPATQSGQKSTCPGCGLPVIFPQGV